MKEKRTYKRFELIPFLAILACVGMLLFESIFVFELYDRAVEQPSVSVPEMPAGAADPVEAVPSMKLEVEPVTREPAAPAAVPAPDVPDERPSAEPEAAPAQAPVPAG